MNSFWMIFLCLLVGALVGFEFGKWMTAQKMKEMLRKMTEDLNRAAEELKERSNFLNSLRSGYEKAADFARKMKLDQFNTSGYQVPDGTDIPGGFDRHGEIRKISALIELMTINGAVEEEIARAVRYSMVVIDTEKLRLDWKKAREDEGIQELIDKYCRPGTGTDGNDIQDGTVWKEAANRE